MRPVGQLVDILQSTEKIRLLDHQGGDVLTFVLAQCSEIDRPAADVESQPLEAQSLVSSRRHRHLPIVRMHGGRHQNAQ